VITAIDEILMITPLCCLRMIGITCLAARTQLFTRMFPRCGIPDSFAGWDDWESYVRFLYETGSVTEHTQIWWSVRPHLAFPTVEIRIADGQPDLAEAQSLAALAYALAVEELTRVDSSVAFEELRFRSYPSFTRIVVEAAARLSYLTAAGTSEIRVRLSGLNVPGVHLEEIDDGVWSIHFCRVLLGRVDERHYIIRT